MAAPPRPKRRSPFGLESSKVYLERAEMSRTLAAAAVLPSLRAKHEAGAARWLEFALRAQKVEQDTDRR